jgi:hypothetical protein
MTDNDRQEAAATKPKTETALPIRVKQRKEIDEPKCEAFNTLNLDPCWNYERRDMVEPTRAQLRTEKLLPTRPAPATDTADPTLKKLRTEKDDDKLTRFSTDA